MSKSVHLNTIFVPIKGLKTWIVIIGKGVLGKRVQHLRLLNTQHCPFIYFNLWQVQNILKKETKVKRSNIQKQKKSENKVLDIQIRERFPIVANRSEGKESLNELITAL